MKKLLKVTELLVLSGLKKIKIYWYIQGLPVVGGPCFITYRRDCHVRHNIA